MSNYEKVKMMLLGNRAAAAVLNKLRVMFADEVIRSAVANVKGDNDTLHLAHKAACQAEETAHALIRGLLMADQGLDEHNAHLAATDYIRANFDRKALCYGASTEPKRVYISRQEQPDSYTATTAPHRVLGSCISGTLYLFSEADARLYTERTQDTLKPLHTI